VPLELRAKGLGYLVSILSVGLLGAVAWSSAARDPLLLACLVLGMIMAIVGMGLRWAASVREARKN